MNAQLGSLGVIVGFVASLAAVATIGYALAKRKRDLLEAGRHYA